MKIDIKGVIVPSSAAKVYAWLGIAHCAPCEVTQALSQTPHGEQVDVYINSPGGSVPDGSEIYEALRTYDDGPVMIHIVGQACSAAAVVAMAARSEMAPTALMMVHRASTSTEGNRNDMQHSAEMLETVDNALCTAFMAKSGMSREAALAMMDRETWLTAEKAVEQKLVDSISSPSAENTLMTASDAPLLSPEAVNIARKQMQAQQASRAQAQLDLLKLKGE